MKLLFCCRCQDIFKLLYHERHCSCGSCGGHYINKKEAVFWGDTAIPLGFNNKTLAEALEAQPQGPGRGHRFEAFVIPKVCPTLEKLDHEIKVRQPGDPIDVHTERCCIRHGCEYDIDAACTVMTGKARQSGPCQVCKMELSGYCGEEARRVALARWPDYSKSKKEKSDDAEKLDDGQ